MASPPLTATATHSIVLHDRVATADKRRASIGIQIIQRAIS